VWLDGALIPEDDARISPQNRGFLYGDGCFETVRIHGGAPFRLDAHFERLRDGLEVLRIEPPWSVEDLRQGARKVVETNGVVEGLVRTTVIGETAYFAVGGGIVADSDPEAEYRETLDKLRGHAEALTHDRVEVTPDGLRVA